MGKFGLRRSRSLGIVVSAALIVAACSNAGGTPERKSARSTETTSSSPAIPDCVPAGARPIGFTSSELPAPTVVLGSGKSGVVLLNQDLSDLCQWFPYAADLAGPELRVLASNALLPEAAVARLRAEGVRQVVLMGASVGARSALSAATTITPPVAGAVSLSAEKRDDLVADLPDLTVPVLLAAAAQDGWAPAEDTRDLAAAIPDSTAVRVIIVPGDAHGVELLSGASGQRVQPAITDFLQKHL